MASSWEAYLKAADQHQIDSTASTKSSISNKSSTVCGTSSRQSLPPPPPPPPPACKTSLSGRTPLSSKAKPFMSSLERRSDASGNQSFVLPVQCAVQWVPMLVPVGQPSYSEEAQEDVYARAEQASDSQIEAIQEDVYCNKAQYSETLQEDVYLREAPKQRGRKKSVKDKERGMPSRTPSPSDRGFFVETFAGGLAGLAEAATVAGELLSIVETQGHAAMVAGKLLPHVGERLAENPCRFQNDASEDEDLKNPPVRYGFIHFESQVVSQQRKGLKRSVSSPSIMVQDVFQVKEKLSMPELHLRGECSPCAYFYHKIDGCRRGSDCTFCHECPSDEIKKRKKQKHKAMKARRQLMRGQAGMSSEQVADEEAGEAEEADEEIDGLCIMESADSGA